jgi:hypothetical protein
MTLFFIIAAIVAFITPRHCFHFLSLSPLFSVFADIFAMAAFHYFRQLTLMTLFSRRFAQRAAAMRAARVERRQDASSAYKGEKKSARRLRARCERAISVRRARDAVLPRALRAMLMPLALLPPLDFTVFDYFITIFIHFAEFSFSPIYFRHYFLRRRRRRLRFSLLFFIFIFSP